MEDLRYISFDNDTEIVEDCIDNDIKGTCVNIKIGNKEFKIFTSLSESEQHEKSYPGAGDGQYELVDAIFALKKLTKFLELSVDIGFSKSLVE